MAAIVLFPMILIVCFFASPLLGQTVSDELIFSSPIVDSNVTLPALDSVKRLEEDYMNALKEGKRPFLGLYGISSYDSDLDNGDDHYEYGLEWRIFDEGYFQAKREEAKKILQTRLEFLQLKRDRLNYYIRMLIQHVHFVETQLSLIHTKSKLKVVNTIMKRREKAIKEGYGTALTFLRLSHQREALKEEVAVLKKSRRERLSPEEAAILNSIEHRELLPLKELFEIAAKKNSDVKIQDLFAARADFYPSWKDDLDFNLYVKERNEFYDKSRVVVGVKLSVPLYFDRHKRKAITDKQKLLYSKEKELVLHKLRRELAIRSDRFRLAQSKLYRAIDYYKTCEKEWEYVRSKRHFPIQKLEKEPLREEEHLELMLVDARFDVLRKRLEAYKALLYLIEEMELQFREINTLFH